MKKILIVDDDRTFQVTMSNMLAMLGYDVVSASDGEEGLTKAISEKPDLVLLDIKMPKLDGLGVLKALQAAPNSPKMPILITSNQSDEGTIADGVSLGVRGYIIKSNETLETIVREVETVLNPEKKLQSVITPAGNPANE